MLKAILFITFICSWPTIFAANYLFNKGKSDYTIILPTDASTTEKNAAEELKKYIQQISGVTLPITTQTNNPKNNHIYIGWNENALVFKDIPCPNNEDESFTYKTVGNDLLIFGGKDRGTMYGVFSFLEQQLGIRWYTANFTYVPQNDCYELINLQHTEKPAIKQRLDFYYEALRHKDWAAHNLLNTQYEHSVSPQYGTMTAYWGIHTFQQLIPATHYFKQHPEYFSMHKGKRVDNAQLCLSNKAMQQELIKNLKEAIQENPNYWCYDVSQNDNILLCECEECQKLVQKYGGQSGIMLWFVNQVAAEIHKTYPDKYIGTFAYLYTRQAPKSAIRPANNVVVRLCNIECCMAHPLHQCKENESFMHDFEDWKHIAKNIYLWDYTTGFSNYMLPFPNLNTLAANYKIFAKSNIIGILEEGAHDAPWNEFSEMKQWVIAKLLWNPNLSVDSLTEQFINDYYGVAAPYILEYYDLCQNQIKDDTHFTIHIDWNSSLFDDRFISEGSKLLKKAQKVSKSDATILQRVNRITAQLLYLKIRRSPSLSLVNGSIKDFSKIINSDNTILRESNYTLDKFLKDIHYY